MPIIIHFIPLQSTKVILLLSYRFISWWNFSVLFCLRSFSASQLLSFFCAFLFKHMLQCLWLLLTGRRGGGVWGKCRGECDWNGGCATLNIDCILFINARTWNSMRSINPVSLQSWQMPFANKVNVVIEPAFFFFVFSIIDIPLSLF